MKVLKTLKKEENNYRNTLTKFSTPNKCSEAMLFVTLLTNQRSKPKETKNCRH